MAKHDKAIATTPSDELDVFGFDWPRLVRWPAWAPRLAETSIKLEEFDEESTHVLRAEIPGIDPDKDVDISVDHGVVTIRAERREESKSEEKGRYRSEFSYGAFTRSVALPAGATENDVKATYRDGILEIRFPIDGSAAAARRVPVSRG